MKIRTFERGVESETLSCGTGCVAAAIIASLKRLVRLPVMLITAGGNLHVSAQPDTERYYLEGDVRIVYCGELKE
jgi:diaminopimelate epimerase